MYQFDGLRLISRRVALLASTIALSGCVGSVYLHSDSAQQAAQNAESGFTAASPSVVFDSQSKFFDSLSAAEIAWVKDSINARRQLSLIALMYRYPKAGTVDDIISAQLASILNAPASAGADSAATPPPSIPEDTLSTLARLDYQIAVQRDILAKDTAAVTAAKQLYLAKHGDPKKASCEKPPTGWPSPSAALSAETDTEALHTSLLAYCGLQEKSQNGLNDYLKSIKAAPGSPMATVLSDYTAAQAALAGQQNQAAELKNALAQAQKAVDSAKQGDPAASVAADLLKLCVSDPTSSVSGASATAAAGAITAGKSGMADPSLVSAANTCLSVAASSAAPLAREVQHNYLADQIQAVLSTVLANQSKPASGTPSVSSSTSKSTASALQTSNLLLGVVDQISHNSQPSVNALLVALAYEQYQVTLNQLLGQTLQKKVLIYQEQREALISEISHLARARKAANKLAQPMGQALPDENAATVLTEVNAAWSVGEYRYVLAQYADVDLIRRDAVARSRQVATAWTNLLQPGFAELTAYGKGGIDAQTVASFLNALINAGGFAAVAGRL